MIRKLLLGLAAVLVLLIAAFLLLVGPWPVYGPATLEDEAYYVEARGLVAAAAEKADVADAPGRLQAGWGKAEITPEIGTPLAGFGDRKGAPSTGVHDPLFVKALALGDGTDTAVIVGADMLIVPENVAVLIREKLSGRAGFDPANILFSATHSHSGPGGWGPGMLSKQFSGEYNESIVTFLADAFSQAISDALEDMGPASIGSASTDCPDLIRNRTRDAKVDPELSVLVVEKQGGKRCYAVSFSAHPTVLSGKNMEFSGDYPGFLQRAIEDQTGAFAMFIGGATGSMSSRAPEGAGEGFDKAAAIGNALATRALEAAGAASLSENADVAAAGAELPLPPFQLRFSENWRVSPFLLSVLHVDHDAWLQGVRVGDIVFIGTPCDFSGELSADLKAWAGEQGVDLWISSFNGDYIGYISPDEYYGDLRDEKGGIEYEVGIMSWVGPNQGEYFSELIKQTIESIHSGGATVAAAS